MKIITICCAVITIVSAIKQEVVKLPPESLIRLKQMAIPCAKEFNVDPIIMYKLGGKTLPRDEATNNFLHCFGVKAGFLDENGHIIVERVAGVLKHHPRAEEFIAVIKNCSEITKENPVATTVANHMCYAENAPILFGFIE